MTSQANIDPAEIDKFDSIASRWWDPQSEFKTLHEINPLRADYIERRVGGLDGKTLLDIGCGGGVLSEALAVRGARVTGIDMAGQAIEVAKLHLLESGLDIDYRLTTAEDLAAQHAQCFDVITCLEMLEHVPDPESIVAAAARMLKPDGVLVLSTLNRNPRAFALAIIGAEYLLQMLPRGTHEYRKFIKPSELAAVLRRNGLEVDDISGISYNPLCRNYSLGPDIDVNYLISASFDD